VSVEPVGGRYLDPDAGAILAKLVAPRRALFLDRDGVMNVDHGYVHTPEQTQWIPGIFDFCREAAGDGFALVVVTNQAGIARGYYTEAQFLDYTHWVHAEFARRGVPLLATYFCPHHPTEGQGTYRRDCECRKPKPGMLLRAIEEFSLLPSASKLIGDKESDLMAGSNAGIGECRYFPGGVLTWDPGKNLLDRT
jgi:D-glycero-D-manno-heptose 1,7-bisphosphate phosphatase